MPPVSPRAVAPPALLLAALVSLLAARAVVAPPPPPPGALPISQRVSALLAQMNATEKIAQLIYGGAPQDL